MFQALFILAQETLPATAPAVNAAADNTPAPAASYTLEWNKWLNVHSWQTALTSVSTLLLILLLGFILSRAFRALLDKHQLLRPVRWGTFTLAVYSAILVIHSVRMLDPHDLLALTLHKLFVAIMLLVAVRFLDRLIVIPVLTRGGRVTLSRFVHQITLAILCLFLAAGYLHWAFDVDVSSVLAGSAVISIVLGLALQETLGNFFSGMVLQASVPFAPGDWVLIGEGSAAVEGRVVEMTWRAVTVWTLANNNILIPNSTVARVKITNYHTPTPATACSIMLALDRDLPPHEASRVLLLAAKDVPGILTDPTPGVAITSYDASTITYSLGFWIDKPQQHGGIEATVRWYVWYRLKQAGLMLPFDTKTIHVADADKQRQASAQGALAERLLALKNSSLFSTVSPELQAQLAARIHDFYLAAGQVFYRQDDPGGSLFLVLDGTVHAVMRSADGHEIDVGDTTMGGVFGDVSAVTGQSRTATVSAKTAVRAAEITRQHLHELLAKEPSLAQHMSRVVAESQGKREELFKQLGALHPSHGENTQPHSVLARMKSFLRL